MAQKKIEDLLKVLSIKYNLPIQVIFEIYNSQFRKLKQEISSLEFKTIKLPAWGKYIPSNKKMEKLKEAYDQKRINKLIPNFHDSKRNQNNKNNSI